jgi:hypothetical protein
MASNFLEWLAETPFLVAFLVLVTPSVAMSVLGILLVRLFYPEEERITGTAAHAKINYMAEIYAVLIGLFLVSAFNSYQDMQTTVNHEALALRGLHQVISQFSPEAQGELPDRVVSYTRLVIEDEWPLLKFGDASAAAQANLDGIFAGIAAAGRHSTADLGVAIQAQQIVQQVQQKRSERLTNGPGDNDRLPNILSDVLIAMTIIAMVMPWFVYTPYVIIHVLLSVGLIVVFISLIILAMKMLYPFAGELMLQPTDFVDALKLMTDVQTARVTP